MQKADNVVLILITDRITCHALLQRRLDIILPGILQIQANHIGTRNHDVAGATVGKVENVIQISKLCFINIAMLVAFFHQYADFVLIVRFFCLNAEFVQHPVGNVIEEPHRRIHQLIKQNQRRSHKQNNLLRLLDGKRFRHQLA